MNVSATNCSPIKPQVTFGSENRTKDFQEVVDKSTQIRDTFTPEKKENGKKSFLGTALSLATAAVVSYAGGKFIAAKFVDVFPKAAEAVSTKLNQVPDTKLVQKAGEFLANKKEALADKKVIGKLVSGVNTIFNKGVDGFKGTKALNNVAGAAGLAVGFSKIATVDGNGDGINDITQKNVSAYKSAIESVGVLSEVVKAVS
ncbi:hypothetical protein IJ182_06380 [bacterium]|nr:hypothetical protein [bacterium]